MRGAIAKELNDRGIPPRGGQWASAQVVRPLDRLGQS